MDKKDEILNAAYEHFAKRGYHVSMSDIAKAVNIKTPSLYSHYESKDEILLLAIQREVQKYQLFLDHIYDNLTANFQIDDLYANFTKILDYFMENDKLRFWRHILLIDQETLRKTCSDLVFELEKYHITRLTHAFSNREVAAKSAQEQIKKHAQDQVQAILSSAESFEVEAIHFIAILQAALEIELLFYESQQQAHGFIMKLWHAYSGKSQ